jgi:hypothetical protein
MNTSISKRVLFKPKLPRIEKMKNRTNASQTLKRQKTRKLQQELKKRLPTLPRVLEQCKGIKRLPMLPRVLTPGKGIAPDHGGQEPNSDAIKSNQGTEKGDKR